MSWPDGSDAVQSIDIPPLDEGVTLDGPPEELAALLRIRRDVDALITLAVTRQPE